MSRDSFEVASNAVEVLFACTAGGLLVSLVGFCRHGHRR
jgi:hypothetical protein